MCLLMKVSKESKFSDAFLRSVYVRNSDGIGVMWAEDGKLHYRKLLPKTVTEAINFFREHGEGKDCCVHWRMKTHGHINYENCHPYPVFGFDEQHPHPMLLMHNGVLSGGNSKDITKSDTWHFIRDTLRPLLQDYPNVVFNEKFVELLGKHIGNNRFAIMDHTGRCAIINRSQGVEYEGSWLSNTYAWDYTGLHPNAPKYSHGRASYGVNSTYGGYYSGSAAWDRYEDKYGSKYSSDKKDKNDKLKKKSKRNRVQPSSTNVISISGTEFKQKLSEEIQEFMDLLSVIDPDVHEKVSFMQARRLLTDCKNIHAPWNLLDALEFGQITGGDFINCMQDPRNVEDVLKKAKANAKNDEAMLLSTLKLKPVLKGRA